MINLATCFYGIHARPEIKFILFLSFMLATISATAQEKVFVREYSYKAGEIDSKISSRANAVNQLRSILLLELGVYVQTEQILKTSEIGSEFSQDFVETIATLSAGITKLEILEEKWNGEVFWMKASIIIDPKSLEQSLKQLINDRQRVKELEALRIELDKTNKELQRLKEEAKNDKTVNRINVERYDSEINKLRSSEHVRFGYVLLDRNDCDGAISEFTKAIELNPYDSKIYSKRAGTRFFNKDYTGAINDLSTACKLKPNYGDACYGSVLIRLIAVKDTINAIKAFDNIRFDGNNEMIVYFKEGILRSRGKDYQSAIQSYSKAIEVENNGLFFYTSRGISKAYLKDYTGATNDFTEAIKINPSDSIAYINRGKALQSLGKSSQARMDFLKARELRETSHCVVGNK